MNRLLIGGVLVALSTMTAAATDAAAPAATAPSAAFTVDLRDTTVVDLWPQGVPGTAPTTEPEVVRDHVDKYGRRDRSVRGVSRPTLTAFLPPRGATALSPAVVVIPGGGYAGEVFDREGYLVAERLRGAGVAAFVLKYRLPNRTPPAPGRLPPPIQDVERAVRLLRAGAARWHVDPHRVGVMGFSAGGHVAGTAATQFDAGDADASDPVRRQSSRPDFAALMYAVSSMHDPLAHAGSRLNLLGPDPAPDLLDRFSTAQHVTPATPPLFIVHAKNDTVVKVRNSIDVADAAKRADVPCELILFETGGHGFGIGTPGTQTGTWIDRFLTWLSHIPG